MSKKVYIETTASGKQRFVKLKRSRSHGHHGDNHHHHLDEFFRHHHHHHLGHHHDGHHHHHVDKDPYCRDYEYYKVSKEEWNVLKERERLLAENNRALSDENKNLRTSLQTAQDETHRLQHCVVPQLQSQNDALYADNQSLRRSIDNAAEQASKRTAEIEKLECDNKRLEKELKEAKEENCDLRTRVHNLSKQLDAGCHRRVSDIMRELQQWKEDSRYWKCKFQELERRHCETLDTLHMRTERMEAYEEILRRRCIIT